jgi:hypothetical protein
MTRRQLDAIVLRSRGAQEEPAVERPSTRDFALLEELSYVRREAQAEADMAYADWRSLGGVPAYAVYRAAQDRADAAQDDLARATRILGLT